MIPNTWQHTAALLYLIFVVPLLVLIPVLQAMERWRTWECVAWVVLAFVGVLAYLGTWVRSKHERPAP